MGDKNIIKSRKEFIEEVAKKIEENHSKGDESFIFGISGKWGEGKTFFLKKLEERLRKDDPSFDISWINPWKFGSDKVSFLRNFIKVLYDGRDVKAKFKRMYFDIDKVTLGFFGIFAVIAVILLALVLPIIFSQVRDFINSYFSIPTTVFATILTILFSTVAITRSSKSTSTLDDFEEVFEEVLEQKDKKGKKVVVYIDDLDRVTPNIARDVLDNLRTFFDKKDVSFVVAGDHSVLERHLGRELLPVSRSPEQIDEGRRFLKKIFNVYWRLPLPTEEEVSVFVDNLFSQRKDEVDKIFSKDGEKETLKKFFELYFERNLRQIERFFETVVFTFRVIDAKMISAQGGEEKYFEELREHPLLVIRCLMIQDLCQPFFDRILVPKYRRLLFDIERIIEKGKAGIENKLGEVEGMSESQKVFIKNFLHEKPRFFENGVVKVSDLRPFLQLAADASFGDQRGSYSEDFAHIIESGDKNQIRDTLLLCGEPKLKEMAEIFRTRIDELVRDGREVDVLFNSVISALSEVEEGHLAHSVFVKEVKEIGIMFDQHVSVEERVQNRIKFCSWMDKVDKELQDYFKRKLNNEEGLICLQSVKECFDQHQQPLGFFGSCVVTNWFNKFYQNDKVQAVCFIKELLSRMDVSGVREGLKLSDEKRIKCLMEDIWVTRDNDFRDGLFDIVIKCSVRKNSVIKEFVMSKMSFQGTVDFWEWALSRASDKGGLWSRRDMESAFISSINENDSFEGVLRFASLNIEVLIKNFWKEVMEKKILNVEFFSNTINDNTYVGIAPKAGEAKIIKKELVRFVKQCEGDDKIRHLGSLKKDVWLWENLPKKDRLQRSNLRGINGVGDKLDEVLETWK